MRLIKKLFLFIKLIIIEFTWDFPIPPKRPSRMLRLKFWKTVLYLYQRRKLETLDYNSKIKNFWKDHNHSQAKTYSAWLLSAFNKQRHVFVNEEIFKQLLSNSPKKFLKQVVEAVIQLHVFSINRRLQKIE